MSSGTSYRIGWQYFSEWWVFSCKATTGLQLSDDTGSTAGIPKVLGATESSASVQEWSSSSHQWGAPDQADRVKTQAWIKKHLHLKQPFLSCSRGWSVQAPAAFKTPTQTSHSDSGLPREAKLRGAACKPLSQESSGSKSTQKNKLG